MNGYDKPAVQLRQADLLSTMKSVAEHFYGWPGRFLYECFEHIDRTHFGGELPVPMLAVTRIKRCQVGASVQTLHIYAGTLARVEAGELLLGYDAVLHQAAHLSGYRHNSEPFCALVNVLSPEIGLPSVDAQVTKCVREGVWVKKATDGSLTQGQLAGWPHSLREPGYYEHAELPFDWRL